MSSHSRRRNRSRGLTVASARSLVGLLLAALAFSTVVVHAPRAHATTYFTFMSRGFGHGIGMSQYGAKGFAEAGLDYATILRHYYGAAGTDPKTQVTSVPSEPTRDVLLDHAAGSGADAFTRDVWTLRPGTVGSTLAVYASSGTTSSPDGWSTFAAEGDRIRWTQPGGRQFLYSGTISVWGVGGTPQLTQVKEPTGQYGLEYVRFRGELRLTASGGKLKLVNRLKMPEYLYGVVPRESPASWPLEALKAQAVAARCYSMRATRTELYTDTRDQVYGGHSRGEDRTAVEMHESSRTNQAVDETLGKVVTYDGDIAQTFFMSTSGGYTENNENVWGGTALPYLRGVPDPYEVYSGASLHSWKTVTYTAEEVRTKLLSAGMSASVVPDPIADIRITQRGVSGRPMTVEFTSATGYKTSVTGYSSMLKFRNAFAWGDHWFVVNPRTTRISGTDRYATSVAASRRVFTAQGSTNPAKAVVVASGAAPADALAASSLAGAVGGAPILLTPGGELDPGVSSEIARLGVTRAYVVGGKSVVADHIIRDMADAGATSVTRLGGVDRYDTARLIALEVKRLGGDSRVLVVNGDTLIDAVTAAGLAYDKAMPIIPVRATSLPTASASALTSLRPTSSIVIGGTAVVSDAVMAKLPNGSRPVSGADRYATARAMCWYLASPNTGFGFNAGSIYLASGTNMVDALAIGPVAGYNRNPVLLAKTWELPSPTRLEIEGQKPWRVHIAGGEAALSGWLQGKVEQAAE